jgi:hypothetical protein
MSWFLLITFLLVTFSVVPLGVDFLRFVFPHWTLSRVVGKAAHIFLFSTVSVLFLIIIRYHHFVFLPLLLNNNNPFNSTRGLFHIVFSSWLWLNVLGNYYHTISMHPGRDASFCSKRVKFEEAKCAYYNIMVTHSPAVDWNGHSDVEENATSTESNVLMPKKNGSCHRDHTKPNTGVEWKPARSHFCPICRCAISYWDHHCPFTGNCIGLRNYANFFIGLCYGMLGSLYAITMTWPFFYHCNLKPLFTSQYDLGKVCVELGTNSYIFVPVLIGCYISAGMVILNVLLLLADISTYDMQKYWGKYPMMKFMFQRICAKKFLEKNSRLQILMVKRRKGIVWYLLPFRNAELFV